MQNLKLKLKNITKYIKFRIFFKKVKIKINNLKTKTNFKVRVIIMRWNELYIL